MGKKKKVKPVEAPKRRLTKVERALRQSNISLRGAIVSEFPSAHLPPEPSVEFIEKQGVNHAHHDTWTGVKKFTHYPRRQARRP